MVDLGQTGGSNSACFILHKSQKNRLLSQSVFEKEKNLSYFSVAYKRATSVQLITLKKASM